jgi:hypothetical protein
MNPVLKKAVALFKVTVLQVLRPRKRLWTEFSDIGLVGGCYAILFFTTGDHLLSTLIALLFSPPGLTQETVAKLLNLIVATFPLAIGTAIVTTAYIGRLQFIRKIQLAWNPLMGILFTVVTLWIFTWIGTLLGVGGISSTELYKLIAGPLSYCYIDHGVQHCGVIGGNPYGIFLFIYYIIAFMVVFWRIYGFVTFVAAFMLGVYLSWAISYKLASHLPQPPTEPDKPGTHPDKAEESPAQPDKV